jgi:hypothetical protein
MITLIRSGEPTKWWPQAPPAAALCAQMLAWQRKVKDERHSSLSMLVGMARQPGELFALLQDVTIVRAFPSGEKLDGLHVPGRRIESRHFTVLDILDHELGRELTPCPVLQQQGDSGVTLRSVMYFMGVLSSRGARAVRHEPPAKVAARRVKEGRSPWVSYHMIRLPREAPASKSEDESGASRTSPRLHWRRGHPRRLASGRIVPIPPILVGASELGEVISSYYMEGA